MPVPTAISDLSQTAASNFPAGSNAPSVLDDVQRAHGGFIATLRDGKGFTTPAVLASAATTDIGAQNALGVEISGTTTITSFGTAYNGPRLLRFTAALTLTHNSSSLILPGAANITTAAGDTCLVMPKTTAGTADGWVVLAFQKGGSAPPPGAAPTFAARAWVKFNGTGTVAINASGNVSSIGDNGTGDYTVNFATAMPHADFAVNVSASSPPSAVASSVGANFRTSGGTLSPPTVTSTRFCLSAAGAYVDCDYVFVTVFC